jgi:NADP-dependent 3-hydroxy acid dehydrogenase YdfG
MGAKTVSRRRRVAAISGGSSGIGRATAQAFSRLGWAVAIGARGAERLAATAAELRATGAEVFTRSLDVVDADSVDTFYGDAEAALGPVDLVVNCAAHAQPGRLHEREPAAIRAEIETGLIGALLFTRRALAGMISRHSDGDLAFLSSTSAVSPWPYLAAYAASKAGIEQAARSLSLELEGTGVRSVIVRVGNTQGTDWTAAWTNEELAFAGDWQRFGLLRHVALLRPDRVAEAIVTAVQMPRGVQFDIVSVQPEAPAGE